MQAQLPVDLKTFEALESKIQKTVELVTRLKAENSSLKSELALLQNSAEEGAVRAKEFDGIRLTSQQLERELLSLKDERQQVLSKVDGLLSSLDGLALD